MTSDDAIRAASERLIRAQETGEPCAPVRDLIGTDDLLGSGKKRRALSDVPLAELGEHVLLLDLLPIGAPRRNWKQTLVSDGMIIVRHPDLERTLEIAYRFATELRIYAH